MNVKRKNYKVPQLVCRTVFVECGFAVSNEVNTACDSSWTDNTYETEL